MPKPLPYENTAEVRDRCLCLQVQQAARALARYFDEVFRPLGLTSGQYSLLMSLNRRVPPKLGEVAALLSMDRTTLTAALKPLQRRDLVKVQVDADDRRGRRLVISEAGRVLLAEAYPLWLAAIAKVEEQLAPERPEQVSAALRRLTVDAESGHPAMKPALKRKVR